jgi:hypothetical protein
MTWRFQIQSALRESAFVRSKLRIFSYYRACSTLKLVAREFAKSLMLYGFDNAE